MGQNGYGLSNDDDDGDDDDGDDDDDDDDADDDDVENDCDGGASDPCMGCS